MKDSSTQLLSKFKIAMEAQEKGNYIEALEILRYLADKNYPPAIGNLGCFYQVGLGVDINGSKAVALLKKAVELGFGPAAHNLGTIYGAGMPSIEPDLQLSKYYRDKAIKLGAKYIK